jgi:hypothetical protein
LNDHLDNLTRHINLVRDACLLLGKRFINRGQPEFGLNLIRRGFQHDVTKFIGIEWDFLHNGSDIPVEDLRRAISQHQKTNDHHPEYWGKIEEMPEIAIAEMVCDWYARAQEFGTGLRDWITTQALPRYQLDPDAEACRSIKKYVDLLLEDHFVRGKDAELLTKNSPV